MSDGLANSIAYSFVVFYLESTEACRRERRGIWLLGYQRIGMTDSYCGSPAGHFHLAHPCPSICHVSVLISALVGERWKNSMTSTNCISQTPLSSGFWLEPANGKLWQTSKGTRREGWGISPTALSLLCAVVLTVPPSLHDGFCEGAASLWFQLSLESSRSVPSPASSGLDMVTASASCWSLVPQSPLVVPFLLFCTEPLHTL